MKKFSGYSVAKLKSIVAGAGAAALFLASSSAQAQTGTTDTWTLAATGSWSTPGNWSAGVPTATSDADFGTSAAAETITLANGEVAQGVYFSDSNSVTLASGSLTIGSDGINIAAGSAEVYQGTTTLVIGASETWTNASSALFDSNSYGFGASTLSTAATLNIASGSWDLRGGLSDGTGGGALTLTVSGGAYISYQNTSASPYSGGTNIQNGTIRTDGVTDIGTGTITLGSATGTSYLQVTNGGTIANALTTTGSNSNILANSSSNTTDTYTGTWTLNNTTNQLEIGTTASSGSSSLIVSGLITGAGGLDLVNLSGGNQVLAVVLNHANTYSGGTTVNTLTLDINNQGTSSTNSAIGTGTLTIAGGTLDNTSGSAINLTSTTNNALVINGTLTFTGTYDLNLGTNGISLGTTSGTSRQISVNDAPTATAGTLTLNGVIANGTTATGISKAGVGTLILGGANTYTGATSITGGILNIQNSSALGTALGTTATGTTISSGATLQLQGGITVGNESLSLTGVGASTATGALENVSGNNTYGGLLTLTGATTISSDAGTLALTNTGTITGANGLTLGGAGNGSVASVIGTGAGTLTKAGTGTWTLTGLNTYTGATTIENGALIGGSSTAFGPGAATITLGDANTAATGSAALLIGTAGVTIANPITIATNAPGATYIIGGSNTTGTATYTGAIKMNNAVTLQAATGGTVDFKSTWTPNGNNFTIGTAGNTGTVEVDSAVTDSYGSSVAINYGTLLLENTFTATSFAVGTNGTLSSNSNGNVTSNATLTGNGVINLNSASSISGTLGVTGGNWNGQGSVDGVVTSSSGDFNIGSGADLTAESGLNVTGGTISSTDATGTITGNVSYGSASASTYQGILAGIGDSYSQSSGTMTVTNNNTYSGGTSLTGGTFYANNQGGVSVTPLSTNTNTITPTNTTGSATGSGSVTVGSGAVLAGTGTIAPGVGSTGVTVQSGGTLASGGVQSNASPYQATAGLTLNNTAGLSNILSVNGGSTLTFALGAGSSAPLSYANPITDSSFLNVVGNTAGEINFDTTSTTAITIDLVDLTTTAPNTISLGLRNQSPYLLIQAGADSDYDLLTSGGYDQNGYVLGTSTGTGVSDTFNLEVTALGSPTPINTTNNYQNLQLYLYNGDLEVVPEPGTWALMIGGLALLILVQRRKSKQS
jgi:fibronectin-binding autotransporter adhesin